MLETGETFDHYEIEGLAGNGGMGVVYRARDMRLGRRVALKLIAPHLTSDPLVRERLNREASVAAAVEHPNVAPLYEAGEHVGTVFLATRWIDGVTLRRLVDREGPLAAGRAARFLAQLGAALQAAHDAGLVHRDVTPSNVLVDGGDQAYLTDFGLTRRASDVTGLTNSGELLGTLDYVAPEQIQGGAVDAAADLYSLGCLGYFLLCGQPPFPREGHAAKLYAHLAGEVVPLTERRPDVPAALDDVVRRAMSRDPADRQPSAAAFAADVLAAVGSSEQPPPSPSRPPEAEPEALAAPRRPARRRRARDLAVVVASGAVLLAAPAALYAGLRDRAAGSQTLRIGRTVASLSASPGQLLVSGGPSGTVTRMLGTAQKVTFVGGDAARAQAAAGRLYVAGGRRLTVLDDATPGRGVSIPLPGAAGALSATPGVAWVALRGRPALARVAGGRLTTLALPRAADDVQAAGRVVWVAAGGSVLRADAATGRMLGPPAYVARRATALAVTGRAVWVLDAARSVVVRLDPRTARPVGAPVPVPAQPVALAADGREVWVVSSAQHVVTRIDARTGRTIDEIGVGRSPSSVALTPRFAWVAGARGAVTRLPRV